MSFDHVLTFCQKKWQIVAILTNCGARRILSNELFAYYWLWNSFGDYNPKVQGIKWHLKPSVNLCKLLSLRYFCGLQSEWRCHDTNTNTNAQKNIITNTQDYNSKDGKDGPDLPPLPVTGHSPRKWMTYKFHRMNGKR